MCTVITSNDLIGRTMDFPPRTPWQLTYLPAAFQWQPAIGGQVLTNRYRILGGMRHFDGHYLLGDGLNSAGLFCAELFFPVAASYEKTVRPGTRGLTPQDFILWVLGKHATVAELAANLEQVSVVGRRWFDDNYYPFHWLLADDSGTYVIEPLGGRLKLMRNLCGGLTNTPALADQVERLNRKLGIADRQFVPRAVVNYQGAWPAGGNSVARFQRAVLTSWQKKPQTVEAMATFLQTVTVPHTKKHEHNYTHYQAVIDRDRTEYRFTSCRSGKAIKRNLLSLFVPRVITFE
ncbi:linear amide C-N hydrolase [Limosilactobacillus oris]|uniref:linear amide C-N hydrolase n=1 Tax=Limosilactobacillus oris TaxID=1632 RepID=UPI00223563C5|nr:linear amide C-N hydrolase [Limosilactobacillus oris]MCW4387164.1 linear amide C-N hydrolase [Limosilactobacillus oris]